jgi:DNA-binding MarR family transcriptional regulator
VTAPDSLEQFAQSFKATIAAVRRLRGRETHRPGELSYSQYGLLFGLAAGGELSTGELALAADISAASATQMLDAMERTGLVERTRSGEDRRVVLTSLTERGREVVESRRALLEPRWRAALAEFSDRDLRTAAAILDRIAEMFDELAERPEEGKLTPAA